MTQRLALHCIKRAKRKKSSVNFRDQMQDCNAKEHEDGIRVYPSVVALCCNEHQCEGNAMQCKPLRHVLNQAQVCSTVLI